MQQELQEKQLNGNEKFIKLIQKARLEDPLRIGLFVPEMREIFEKEIARISDESTAQEAWNKRSRFLSSYDVDGIARDLGGLKFLTQSGTNSSKKVNLRMYPGEIIFYIGAVGGKSRIFWEIYRSKVFGAQTTYGAIRDLVDFNHQHLSGETKLLRSNYGISVLDRMKKENYLVKNEDGSFSASLFCQNLLYQEEPFKRMVRRFGTRMIKLYK